MAVSACGEGCHAQMELMLNHILDCVLPFLKDPVCYSCFVFIKVFVYFTVQVDIS